MSLTMLSDSPMIKTFLKNLFGRGVGTSVKEKFFTFMILKTRIDTLLLVDVGDQPEGIFHSMNGNEGDGRPVRIEIDLYVGKFFGIARDRNEMRLTDGPILLGDSFQWKTGGIR